MKRVLLFIFITVLIYGTCSANSNTESEITISTWSEETHSNSVEPNYDVVFNSEDVMEVYISIDESDWDKMIDQLDENLAGSNMGRPEMGDMQKPPMGGRPGMGERPPMGEGEMPQMGERPPLAEGEMPPMGDRPEIGGMPEMGIGNTEIINFDPIWVESDITVDGVTWENVGIRFKGNSSLMHTYQDDGDKYSFKLDFDEFEEKYPELEDQRFFGFKQLNLNNNYNDNSFMRESVAADLFREYGLTAAETTFCLVYVDHGSGSELFGLYTLVEEMDDTVIDTQYEDGSGNLYKPDGAAATFGEGTYNEEEFDKKSNEDEIDYSDVEKLYEAINSPTRVTDLDVWKSELEGIFDVDIFLKWLAVNSVIQNWDTYGQMSHNYFLYSNPQTGKLEWIPWDNNEALQSGKRTASTLSMDEITEDWPLIRYLLDDEEYVALYKGYIDDFTNNYFTIEKMTEIYEQNYEQLSDLKISETSDKGFSSAVEQLKEHVIERTNKVVEFLQ